MAKAKDKESILVRYERIHRFWTGVSVLAALIVVIGSAASGARIITIVFRGLSAIVVLSLLGRILIKSWASWEEVNRGEG